MSDSPERTLTLGISCPDRVGIVARVATFLAQHGGWILESNHHADAGTGRFFMRNVIRAASLGLAPEEFRALFAPIAREFDMDWRLTDSGRPPRVVLLASRADHCVVDILHRWRSGDLHCDVPCIVSNHEDLRGLARYYDIEFHHVTVSPGAKDDACARIGALYEAASGDVMVLARYMQILSGELCRQYAGRIINIHHSFLPSFIGASPYRQAFDRGVKLIGATCHYVTEDLDEGPIIEQDVIRIDHGDTVDDLVGYGKDIERQVLARGLKYHLEDRVFLNGHKTVVFR
jgi:formyltetrahydrofolate deformylase